MNSEKKLVENIISHLKGKGYFVATEVPFLSRSIDIVYQTKKKEIVAIEAKMDHCKKALNQAKYCMLGASRVYVCLPERKITEKIKKRYLEMGVGLIHADKPSNGKRYLRFEIGALRNRQLIKDYREILFVAFKKRAKRY